MPRIFDQEEEWDWEKAEREVLEKKQKRKFDEIINGAGFLYEEVLVIEELEKELAEL